MALNSLGVEGDPSLTSSSMWTAVHGELLLIFGNLHLACPLSDIGFEKENGYVILFLLYT